jgi:hypothetical protein
VVLKEVCAGVHGPSVCPVLAYVEKELMISCPSGLSVPG